MKTYRIYGKINNMKRFAPIGGDSFVTNLIYAELFDVHNNKDQQRLNELVTHLNTTNDGTFELRRAN